MLLYLSVTYGSNEGALYLIVFEHLIENRFNTCKQTPNGFRIIVLISTDRGSSVKEKIVQSLSAIVELS